MRLALADAYRPHWSDQVQQEWTDALARDRPDLPRAKIDRVRALMEAHVPGAAVTGYEPLVEARPGRGSECRLDLTRSLLRNRHIGLELAARIREACQNDTFSGQLRLLQDTGQPRKIDARALVEIVGSCQKPERHRQPGSTAEIGQHLAQLADIERCCRRIDGPRHPLPLFLDRQRRDRLVDQPGCRDSTG